jgi:alpha-N-acetylglucosaminidase
MKNIRLLLLPLLCFIYFKASAQLDKNAAKELIQRVVPSISAQFIVEEIPADKGKDVFEIQSRNGKIVLRGNKALSVASALGYYLKYYCRCDISWNGGNMKLPARLPVISKTIHHATLFTYRYYLNYCTFNYSMSWWQWDRWQREIDWMALNGINLPLALTGEEAIWQKVYRQMGFTNDELAGFFSGPAYFSWSWMGNLDGWDGPLPQHWIDSHEVLQKKILARERELGMMPVLPAFSGHVPPSFKDKFPQAKLRKTNWGQGFNDVYLLDPTDPMFAQIGKKFIEEQTKIYGSDHYYSSDAFNENTPPTNDSTFLSGVSKNIYQSMAAADPKAVWVMQGWLFLNNSKFWQPTQIKAALNAVPDDHMIILDLFTDENPVWQRTDSYYGKPWIWNMLQNFGGVVGMHGRVAHVADQPLQDLKDSKNMVGIGLTPEAIEQNPAVYDAMMSNVWRDNYMKVGYDGEKSPAMKDSFIPYNKSWMQDYTERRYGKKNANVIVAWQGLLNTVYTSEKVKDKGVSSIIVGRPSLNMGDDWRVDTTSSYDQKLLIQAWQYFLKPGTELRQSAGYQYDAVNITRQVMANYANRLEPEIIKAYKLKDEAGSKKYSIQFLQLMSDMDELLATRKDFLLGKWLKDARTCGITPKESDLYELNARDLITLWGDKNSPLHEYANKQWSGLIKGFYKPRWQMFLTALNESLKDNKPFDNNAFEEKIKNWEWSWVNAHNSYKSEPTGDAVAVAQKMYSKYYKVISASY